MKIYVKFALDLILMVDGIFFFYDYLIVLFFLWVCPPLVHHIYEANEIQTYIYIVMLWFNWFFISLWSFLVDFSRL